MPGDQPHISRLDNFVDGAFAFAVTLLVINGSSVPRDIPSLLRALGGVPAFACCFAQLAWFWHGHVRWRTRAQVGDRPSLLLSLLLVFFALIFVYPLHMVYSACFYSLSGGVLSADFHAAAGAGYGVKALFVVFGLAFACMAGTLAALLDHGARRAPGLSPLERVGIHVDAASWIYSAAVGLVSAAIALIVAPDWIWLAGISYALLGFMSPVLKMRRSRLRKSLAV
ncbi:MAG TPA: TMEM175 family protein [Gammaproteobacteria bacterium]|nr:TMEM175 family protein [Gammaproteobacteria bacterium]